MSVIYVHTAGYVSVELWQAANSLNISDFLFKSGKANGFYSASFQHKISWWGTNDVVQLTTWLDTNL